MGACIDITHVGILQLCGRLYSSRHAILYNTTAVVLEEIGSIYTGRRCHICLSGERECAYSEFGGGVMDLTRARKIYHMLDILVVISGDGPIAYPTDF